MKEVYRICFLLVTLLKVLCQPCVPNCVKMDIVDNPSKDDVILVEENLVVNLTFHVDTTACIDNTQQWVLKLSTFEKEMAIDKCKIPFSNGMCQKKAQKEPCSCFDSNKRLVQIHENFNGSYYQVYSWTGMTHDASTDVKLLKRIFVVFKSKTNGNQMKTRDNPGVQYLCLSLPVVIAVCASAAIVVVIAIIFIVKSCKTKNKSTRTTIAIYDNRQTYDHLSRPQ
ncbi:uncharacterized protein LOC112567815 isoform X2 [Pomacea canaliculata]|uniref:uncharacterized protein LOC112567815 isoform X2 n=1 Tax=Pomacea canaliculata TaxID=400727 RepID=UPI000D7311BB|nr:uncharacterized protein LOC112567815 isoform X2 [Pomacea canaliculata]